MPVIIDRAPAVLPAAEPDIEGLYPIREVARLTGINPVTLRAWERRYGLIEPKRTESGHRLYSMTDIETVRQVQGWIERGVSVSKVGELLARRAELDRAESTPQADEYAQWQSRISEALSAFDERELERLYGQIFSSYPPQIVFNDVFMPLWQLLLRQQDEFGRTSEWLLLDSFLRGRVLQRLNMQGATEHAQCVVLVGLPELCHELQLRVTGLLLARSDRAIRVLAVGQPLNELSLICEKVNPQALVLLGTRALSPSRIERLSRVVHGVSCAVWLAGEACELAHDHLLDSSIGCLGCEPGVMSQRLDAYLKGA